MLKIQDEKSEILNHSKQSYQPEFLDQLRVIYRDVLGRKPKKSLGPLDLVRAIKRYYENLIAVLPNNVYWLDRKCQLLGCNNNVAKLFGLPRQECVGLNYKQMSKLAHLTKGQAFSFEHDDKEVMQTGEPKINVEEPPLPGEDGKPVSYYISSRVPLRDQSANIVGVVGISTNITRQKLTELKLGEARDRANMIKDEFIANMEHDFRTPTSGITSLLDHLAMNEKNVKKRTQLFLVARAGRQLLNLLNNILDFDHIDYGKKPILEKRFNIIQLIQEVIDLEMPAAENKKLKLISNIDSNIPELVIGDDFRFHRILINLVSNAIKFTQKGFVEIRVAVARKMDRKNIVIRVDIEDTGIGIPKEKQDYIYEKFTSLTPSNCGLYAGVGLGLKIVKQFLNELGGEIHLESVVNQGSTFTCYIPFKLSILTEEINEIDEGANNMHHKKTDKTSKKEIIRCKLLLVEDDPIAQIATSSLLKENICEEVDIASSGSKAIELCNKKQYDIIFMDLGLPDMTGFEVADNIRAAKTKNTNTIILALTAHSDREIQDKCKHANMNGFITKPLKKEEIDTIKNDFLHQY